jgi:hypothetical protein
LDSRGLLLGLADKFRAVTCSRVQEMGTKILQAGLALHERVSSTFRKTAVNFHYEFTVGVGQGCWCAQREHLQQTGALQEQDLHYVFTWHHDASLPIAQPCHEQVRHLANVFQGLLMSSPDVINSPTKWAKLWLHESERVYADRLVSQAVRANKHIMKRLPNILTSAAVCTNGQAHCLGPAASVRIPRSPCRAHTRESLSHCVIPCLS